MVSYPPTRATSLDALVLASSGLAGLELVEVPVADRHVAVVLVHALGEGEGGSLAVVALLLLSGLSLHGGLGRGLGSGGAAAKETADGVTDGGTDSDTAIDKHVSIALNPSKIKEDSGKHSSMVWVLGETLHQLNTISNGTSRTSDISMRIPFDSQHRPLIIFLLS